jgi:hypothetical protein
MLKIPTTPNTAANAYTNNGVVLGIVSLKKVFSLTLGLSIFFVSELGFNWLIAELASKDVSIEKIIMIIIIAILIYLIIINIF